MNLGIFGGTFDPPHLGHLIVAESVQEQLPLEVVLFVPVSLAPHKPDGTFASPSHRLKMVQLAVNGNPRFRVSDVEVRRGGTSYTIDTLHTLRSLYPADKLFLIIGTDNLQIFRSWKEPQEVLKASSVVVINRPGFDRSVTENEIANRVRFIQVPAVEISGTDIRERIRTGRSVRYLVPDSVRAYIEENHLYRS